MWVLNKCNDRIIQSNSVYHEMHSFVVDYSVRIRKPSFVYTNRNDVNKLNFFNNKID